MAVSILEYEKALHSLKEAIEFAASRDKDSEFKIARDAAIQRFEFCVELAWKTSAKKLGSSSTSPKPVIREMLQSGYIRESDLWFSFIDARNKSSHTYEEQAAREVYDVLLCFIDKGFELLNILKSK